MRNETKKNYMPLEGLLRAAEAEYREGMPTGWLGAPCAALLDATGAVLTASDIARSPSIRAAGKSMLTFFGRNWSVGDVALTNDPFNGSTHLLEFGVAAPLNASNTKGPSGFAFFQANVPDLGGWDLGGDDPRALDIWAEGARIVPVKTCLAGKPRKELLEILALNSRTPQFVQKSVRVMSEVVLQLAKNVSEYRSDVDEISKEARKHARIKVLNVLKRFSGKTCRGSASIPIPGFDGAMFEVEVEVSFGTNLRVNVLRAPERSVRPINATIEMTRSAAFRAAIAGLNLEAVDGLALDEIVELNVPPKSAFDVSDWLPVGYARRVTQFGLFAAILDAFNKLELPPVEASMAWRRATGLQEDDLDLNSGRLSQKRRSYLAAMEAAAGDIR